MTSRELRVRQGHPDVGHRIPGIGRDRLPEVVDALLDRVLGVSTVAVPSLEIELIGLHVVGRFPSYPRLLRRRKLRAQRGGDLQGDIHLDREDVGELPVVRLGPQVPVGRCIDELGDDAHSVPRAPHTPFEQSRHAELLSDLTRTQLAGLERHH